MERLRIRYKLRIFRVELTWWKRGSVIEWKPFSGEFGRLSIRLTYPEKKRKPIEWESFE